MSVQSLGDDEGDKSLGGIENSNEPQFRRARFVISGVPFDIPSSELAEWEETTLFTSAHFAAKSGKEVINPNDPKEKIPFVEFSEDPEPFRILRHFMKTRQLIIPPDPVRRQLLQSAAEFYNFATVIRMLATGARAEAPSANEGKVTPSAEGKTASVEGKTAGNVMPSSGAIESVGGIVRDFGDQLAPFWRKGEEGLTILDVDAEIRATEHHARVVFGKEEDGTKFVPTAVLFDEKTAHKFAREDIRYPHFVYPNSEIKASSVQYVTNFEQFKMQFNALTDGILDGILETQPLVVAGGSVLTALHVLPRTKISERQLNGFVRKVSKHLTTVSDDYVEKHFGVVVNSKECDSDSGSDKQRPDSDSDGEPKKTKKLSRKRAPSPRKKSPPKVRASASETKDDQKQDLRGEIRNSLLYFRYMFTTDKAFRVRFCAADVDESEATHELAKKTWTSLSADRKVEIRKEFAKWKSDQAKGRPDEKPKKRVFIIESKSPEGFRCATLNRLIDLYQDGGTERDFKIKLALREADVDKLKFCLFLRRERLSNDGDRTYNLSDRSIKNCKMTDGLELDTDNADSRGVAVSDPRVRMYESFRKTDIDLFLTTQDPDKALAAIFKLYERLREHYGEQANEITIIRTEKALTFNLPGEKSIQVISRLYKSLEHVLISFDLDCCSVGFDGKRVLAGARAVRSLNTRTILVDPTRQSLNYEARLLKYAKRGFSIAVPGLDIKTQMAAVLHKLATWRTTDAYVGFCGVQLLLAMMHSIATDVKARKLFKFKMCTSDYRDKAAEQFNIDNVDMRFDPSFIMTDKTKLNFVKGKDLKAVLFSNSCTISTYKGAIERQSTLPPIITFQVKASHIQDRVDLLYTGSFSPTNFDWYNGV